MIEQALRTFLLGKSPVATAVCNRIHVGEFVPLKKEDLPAIGIETDPQERQVDIDGVEVPMQFPHFDIVVKSQQFSTSITIGDLIAAAFRSISLGTVVTLPGASPAVTISQVDILGRWNEKEEDAGHGLAVKSRVVKIRVGWLEDTSTI